MSQTYVENNLFDFKNVLSMNYFIQDMNKRLRSGTVLQMTKVQTPCCSHGEKHGNK